MHQQETRVETQVAALDITKERELQESLQVRQQIEESQVVRKVITTETDVKEKLTKINY